KLPFFALSAASCVATFLVQRISGAIVPLADTPFMSRLANALLAYSRYLAKTFWPSKLAVFYPYTQSSFASGQVLGSMLLLALITAAVCFAAKQKRYLAMGWFWFLGTLVPVIGIVQV